MSRSLAIHWVWNAWPGGVEPAGGAELGEASARRTPRFGMLQNVSKQLEALSKTGCGYISSAWQMPLHLHKFGLEDALGICQP